MQTSDGFDIAQKIQQWKSNLMASDAMTERDCTDLEVNLLDRMDDYQSKGLDQEDAFYLAVKNLGGKTDWEHEFSSTNHAIIQVKKTLGLIGGVLIFFFVQYFILVLDKSIVLALVKLAVEPDSINAFSRIFLQAICLFTVFGLISLIIKEKRFIMLIGKSRFTPKTSTILLLCTVGLAIIDRLYYPSIRKLITDDSLPYDIFNSFLLFEYAFPLIISIGFVLIYRKYYKESKK